MISMVEVEIGGQRIDASTVTGCTSGTSLPLPVSRRRGYHKMVGQTTQLTYLTDPQFADVATACGAADVPARCLRSPQGSS